MPYPGRPAPHIHFKVKKGDRTLLTSQINIAGHPGNEVDGVVRGGISVFDLELLMADFRPIPGSKIGELAAEFTIVLGRTPDEHARGALADSARQEAVAGGPAVRDGLPEGRADREGSLRCLA